MPCSDGGSYEEEERKRSRKATRAACDMRTIIRRAKLEKELTRETREWIAEHDEEDRIRIHLEEENGVREKTRKKALEKLTLDERRALGL